MDNFLKIIFGDQPVESFAGDMCLALIGILITLLFHAVQRNQASPNTPVDFDIKFLFKDNALRLLASLSLSLFVVFACIRFTNDILHVSLSPFIALLIGLGSDKLAEGLKNLSSSKIPFETVKTTVEDKPEELPARAAGQGAPVVDIDQSKPAVDQATVGTAATVTNIVEQNTQEEKP